MEYLTSLQIPLDLKDILPIPGANNKVQKGVDRYFSSTVVFCAESQSHLRFYPEQKAQSVARRNATQVERSR